MLVVSSYKIGTQEVESGRPHQVQGYPGLCDRICISKYTGENPLVSTFGVFNLLEQLDHFLPFQFLGPGFLCVALVVDQAGLNSLIHLPLPAVC